MSLLNESHPGFIRGLGAGIAGCAIAYIIVVAIAGGRPNVRWGGIAIAGGILLTTLGYTLEKIFA